MVAGVATHKDECVGGEAGACEGAEVADGVARGIEEVEGAVVEVVDCFEAVDCEVDGVEI